MSTSSDDSFPKLRPLEIKRVMSGEQPCFLLRDTLRLSEKSLMVPEALGSFLALCDGSRDIPTLASAFTLHTGSAITRREAEQIVQMMSEALFLDDARFRDTFDAALRGYRDASHRQPALAGLSYPSDPEELATVMDEYCRNAPPLDAMTAPSGPVTGIVSPHIDYKRGWATYAGVWSQSQEAIRQADLIVVFGTDHSGGPGTWTLTRQHYATPWGVLPTATAIVEGLAAELGEDAAFGEELHHRGEHSIEMALVWLHYFLRPRTCEVVPILCGSFHPFIMREADLPLHDHFQGALDTLRRLCQGRNVLVVAAADLAHVGPVFGDATPWDTQRKEALRLADRTLLDAVNVGDHARFFEAIQGGEDQHRICGMPPIYSMLRFLQGATGRTTGYDQCPADEDGHSLVSVAGVTLHRPS